MHTHTHKHKNTHTRAHTLSQGGGRIFAMQKLVEVTHYNMSRIRIVWSRIWAILGEHFQSVALRHEQQVRVIGLIFASYLPSYLP